MPEIDRDIAAYEAMRNDLEAHQMGKWVVLYNCNFVQAYDSFEQAAEDAVRRFGSGPYLIRQVGAPPVVLPASVMFNLQRN